MSLYTTGELAKQADVTVRTVQYYDERGILRPSEWSDGGRRLYSEDDLTKLHIICYLRELGFSIAQIKDLFEEENTGSVLATLLDAHISSLESVAKLQESKLRQLRFLRTKLQHQRQFDLNQLPDISLTMKHHDSWRRFAIKQYAKLLLLIALFIGLIYLAASKESLHWLAIPATFLYLAGIASFVWSYYQKVHYLCPTCHQTFQPEFVAFLLSRHTPRTRRLTCPHCHHKNSCIEVTKETSHMAS